jgi:hypothetical protein
VDEFEPHSRSERAALRQGSCSTGWVRVRVLVGLVVLALAALAGPAAAASARSTGGIPACPAGTNASMLPACVISSWVDPTRYGSRVEASLKRALTRKWVKASPATGSAHWVYTAIVLIHGPLGLCPQPTPLGSIPCQNGAPVVSLRAYQQAKTKLEAVPSGFSVEPAVCNPQGSSCSLSFAVYPENVYGTVDLLFTVGVQQLTKNPANDLGQAGAQFASSISVAKVEKPQ